MMKKTIGLLAALMLTLSAAGVSLPASAEEYTAEQAADTEADSAEETSDEENDEKAEIEQFAQDHFDPEYGKYLKSLEAAEETAAERSASMNKAYAGGQGGSSTYDKYTGYTYTHQDRFENCEKVVGVDVSYFQYQIDWKKVKADGVDFAIIRLGYRGYGYSGDLVLDTRFRENIENAKAAGLEVGVYFYTQAITTAEAVEEAEYCIKNLKGYSLDLPVYFDIETVDWDTGRLDSAGLSVAQKTNICKAFCNRIKKAGYEAGVYSNPYWMNYMLNASELEKLYPIWLANYTTYTSYDGLFDTWQYAYTGDVDGIQTGVDMNFDYRTGDSAGTGDIAPDAPSDITAYLSDSGAVIEWEPVENADKYEVYRINSNTGRYIKISTVISPRITVSATSSPVSYAVRALRISGGKNYYSDYSDIISISNKIVSDIDINADTSKITLSWDEVGTADGYVIYRAENDGSFTELATVDNPSYADTDVSGGVKYSYKVAAYTEDGDDIVTAPMSKAVSAVLAPKKISSITQSARYKNSITVKFGHLINVSGYQFATYDPETGAYIVKGTVSPSVTSYKFTSLKEAAPYQLCVRAYVTAGGVTSYGEWSSPLKTATLISVPTELKSTITPSKVTLSYTPVNGAKGYNIYRKTSSTYVKVANTDASSISFTDNTVGSRTYAVSAYFTANNRTYTSGYSAPCVIDGTLPGTPSFTSATGSNGTAALKWSAVPNVTGYRVYMYNSATGAYETAKTINAKNTSCTITGIWNSNAKFKVKAFRRETNGTVWGNASAIKTVRFALNAPGYIYSTTTPGYVKVTWDAVDGADSYTVYKLTDYGYTEIGTTADSSLKFTDNALGSKTYAVTANVNSEDGVITSDYSIQSVAAAIPSAPRFISQSGGSDSVKLAWNRDYTVDGYRIYLYNKDTGNFEKVKTIQSGAKTTCTVSGLEAGTTYRFKIKSFARGSFGISWSGASDDYYVTTASGFSLE